MSWRFSWTLGDFPCKGDHRKPPLSSFIYTTIHGKLFHKAPVLHSSIAWRIITKHWMWKSNSRSKKELALINMLLWNLLSLLWNYKISLQWCHNDRDGDGLFRRRPKKTSRLRVTGLCGGPPVTGWFPSQRASNTENVSISWRHHVIFM